MKKLVVSLVLCSLSSISMADGRFGGGRPEHHHHTGGGGWMTPLIIGGSIGYILGRPQPQPQVIIQQPTPPVVMQPQTVYVYPTTAPVIQAPGMYCELRSEMVNGQVVTGNFCYQR